MKVRRRGRGAPSPMILLGGTMAVVSGPQPTAALDVAHLLERLGIRVSSTTETFGQTNTCGQLLDLLAKRPANTGQEKDGLSYCVKEMNVDQPARLYDKTNVQYLGDGQSVGLRRTDLLPKEDVMTHLWKEQCCKEIPLNLRSPAVWPAQNSKDGLNCDSRAEEDRSGVFLLCKARTTQIKGGGRGK
ncbi:unnamed protein product [Amoebophrya sp. A120]|nr:unnamed protein product [Amoebophrya sp. A120]|eukprot:GSA120T00000606001.1